MTSQSVPTLEPIIRRATKSDIPAMMELSASVPTAAQWSHQQYHQALSCGPERCKAFVIEHNSQILGFLVAQGIDTEWEIENIVISPSEQRNGLGHKLLKQLMKSFDVNISLKIFLEVRESNHTARAFYQKSGFRQTGRRSRYYTNPPEDALIYQLDIP